VCVCVKRPNGVLFVRTVRQFSPDVPASNPDVLFSAVSHVALRLDDFSDMCGRGTLEG
jgi:hypothetical protein